MYRGVHYILQVLPIESHQPPYPIMSENGDWGLALVGVVACEGLGASMWLRDAGRLLCNTRSIFFLRLIGAVHTRPALRNERGLSRTTSRLLLAYPGGVVVSALDFRSGPSCSKVG